MSAGRCPMRSLFFVGMGLVLFFAGCIDRPERSPSAYGTVLKVLPTLQAAEEPFPFPKEGDNDHQNCVFDESDFL